MAETPRTRKNTLRRNISQSTLDQPAKRARIGAERPTADPEPQIAAGSAIDGGGSLSNHNLAHLLDFTSLTSDSGIRTRFGQIARTLLNDHVLVITPQSTSSSTVEYEFLEVEFYLRIEGIHEDPFTHGTKEQSESGKWYFHRAPSKSSDPTRSATSSGYRGGTRKGLDLTIGGPFISHHFTQATSSNGPRGGILLRSLHRLSDGAIISGPSLLVDEILRVCQAASISALVTEKLAGDTSAFSSTATTAATKKCSIAVKHRSQASAQKSIVYSSPRIGLDLSHPGTTTSPSDPRVVFVQRHYRYFTRPSLLIANGRTQTLLGIYKLIAESEILNEESLRREVSRITGIKRNIVDKYIADYQLGKEKGNIKSFTGANGKGASSSPASYLKMMGTLSTLS